MKKALITSTGSVAADITIKSLKRMGFIVVGCNMFPKEFIAESCEVDVFHRLPPVSEANCYLEKLKEICLTEKVNFVLPMIDYEIDLLNDNRKWFSENDITLCISPKETIEIIRNKKVFQDFVARECPQIQSIPTMFLKDIKNLKWEFPVVCKPFNGRSSQGLVYIYDENEWERFVISVDSEKYIVEPYIDGPRIVVEVVRQANFNTVVSVTRREIISTSNGLALTVYVYQDNYLEDYICKLAEKLGVIGDVNFEFILDKSGVYHIIECNPRFSGGCEFVCIAGYDCVANHIRCFMNENIEVFEFKQTMMIARKYEEVLTAVDIDLDYFNTIY